MAKWMTALVLISVGVAASVSADAVDPPSVRCPAGTLAQPSHYPREGVCLPQVCASDADCGGGTTCEEAPLCIVPMPVRQRDAGTYPDGGYPEPVYYDTAPASCGGTCAMGTCETTRVCMPPPSSGGGCAVGGRASAFGAWIAIALVLVAFRSVRRVRTLVVAAVVVATGCGSTIDAAVDASTDAASLPDAGPSVPYAPLVRDPSRAGELAFGAEVAGAFFALPEYQANGNQFLFIDHAGRYWAQQFSPLEVRTGALDDATLAALNAELLTGPWDAVDGEHDTSCCDAPTTYLARDAVRASVYQGALASDRLRALIDVSSTWTMRLSEMGAPMTGGRVRLELWSVADPGTTPTTTWPMSTPLASVLGGLMRNTAVFEGADADTLRATRQGVFRDGTVMARFLVADAIPFADAEGCLRPFGGTPCR